MSRDKDAFRILYDNYSSTLYGIVLKIVGSAEVAEDVLPESFVKIWKNISSYDKNKGRLFKWLFNITSKNSIYKLCAKHEKYQIQRIDESEYQVDKQKRATMKVKQ